MNHKADGAEEKQTLERIEALEKSYGIDNDLETLSIGDRLKRLCEHLESRDRQIKKTLSENSAPVPPARP